MRDAKITQIYEGTNGIQAMDLLGRKLGMNKGAAFMDFITEIKKTVSRAEKVPGLEALAASVSAAAAALHPVRLRLLYVHPDGRRVEPRAPAARAGRARPRSPAPATIQSCTYAA